MPIIIIKRKKEYNNHLRNLKIFIDGKIAGEIANGETKNFEVTAGEHTVIAKIDWCSSQEISIDVSDKKITKLRLAGFKNGNWMMPVALGIFLLHYLLQSNMDFHYFGFLAIPFLAVLGYYLTFGRKKYLMLVEDVD